MEENKKVCSKCGTELMADQKYCNMCGTDCDTDTKKTNSVTSINTFSFFNPNDSKLKKYMKYCFIVAAIMFLMGFYKTNFYKNSEYSWETTVNAYVGGDAYNYIINGNYATGYYVLGTGFMITGAICGCTDEIIKSISKKEKEE